MSLYTHKQRLPKQVPLGYLAYHSFRVADDSAFDGFPFYYFGFW